MFKLSKKYHTYYLGVNAQKYQSSKHSDPSRHYCLGKRSLYY